MTKLLRIYSYKAIIGLLITISGGLHCYDDSFESAIEKENSIASQPNPFAAYPVPGNGGIITISNITASTLIIHWARASDDITAQSDLEYRVYRSLSNNISSFATAVAQGTELTSGWTVDSVNFYDNGLLNGTTYYYNVFVQDEENNISSYYTTSAHTTGGSVFLFPAGTSKGNLDGRSGADYLCQEAFANNYPDLPVATIKAFISISASDQISDIPTNYGLPTDLTILAPLSTTASVTYPLIANDWSDLLDGTINETLNNALGADHWWSGSDANGDFIDLQNNCNGFTDNTNSFHGMTGDKTVKDSTKWISNKAENCNVQREVLCIAW
jgi:hypothetical protein